MAVQKHDIEDYEDLEVRAFGLGEGNSKRDGEQKAAKMCLIKLGLLNEDQYNDDDLLEIDFNDLSNSEEQNDESNILDDNYSNNIESNSGNETESDYDE